MESAVQRQQSIDLRRLRLYASHGQTCFMLLNREGCIELIREKKGQVDMEFVFLQYTSST